MKPCRSKGDPKEQSHAPAQRGNHRPNSQNIDALNRVEPDQKLRHPPDAEADDEGVGDQPSPASRLAGP